MSEEKPENPTGTGVPASEKQAHQPRVKTSLFKWAAVAGVLVAVAAIAVLAFSIHSSNKAPKDAVFEIEGRVYTKAQIEPSAKILSASNGKSLQEAGRRIFSYYKEQKAAQEVGITVPQTAIDAQKALVSKVFTQKSAASLVDITAYHNALQDYYLTVEQGTYKGYAFIFDFSARVIPQRSNNPTPGYNDPQLIAKDDAYAKEQANSYHDQIANGKLTAAQLLDKIQADASLGLTDPTVRFTTLDSTSFDTTIHPFLAEQIGYKQIVTYITQQEKLGLSSVQQGEVATTNSSVRPAKYAPGIYYFVQLDEAKKGVTKAQSNVEQQLRTMKAKYYGL